MSVRVLYRFVAGSEGCGVDAADAGGCCCCPALVMAIAAISFSSF